ncbi:VOC family protein [Streptomyces sp. NRRL F-5123]|uniref:VOC family protein n=1 Tax=Streptomyces sp. NRRL F-5123 TaxID=1463856 RepID=UPI0004E0B0C4|nr:VOC family protein [Streptomyces sp. NRRL F-5123]
MAVQRMDNVLIVVEDLDAVITFFEEIGLELEGRFPLNGTWAERVIGLRDVRQEVAMLRVPGGHGRVELARFDRPRAVRPEPYEAPSNTLGLRRVMFAVDDIRDTVARLRGLGAEVVDEIVRFENAYLLAYVRGPENIVVGLAEELNSASAQGDQ